MKQQYDPEELIKRYNEGICSDEEIAILESWHLLDLAESDFEPTQENITHVNQKMRQVVIAHAREYHRTRRLWPRMVAAACILFFLGIGTFLIRAKYTTQETIKVQARNIQPGGNKAILTLANGRQILLTGAKAGILAIEGKTAIKQTADGNVAYSTDSKSNGADGLQYNTMVTPKGGQYHLTLSDGTNVWLNAASSIKFPTLFPGKERKVEITGEVYFEVVHNAAKPFRVISAGQSIEVLGTHFNVNAYPDESGIRTTLLQGSIKIAAFQNYIVLKPGQQAQIVNNKINIRADADLDEAIAWHKGLFQFHDADIQTVMRQLSRWYDVDIHYEGKIPDRRFSGKIYRNTGVLKISDILSYKKIHFHIDKQKIIVTP